MLPYAVITFTDNESDESPLSSEIPSVWLTDNNSACW